MKRCRNGLLLLTILGIFWSCNKKCEDEIIPMPDGFPRLMENQDKLVFALHHKTESLNRDTLKLDVDVRSRVFDSKSTVQGCTNYQEFYMVKYYGDAFTLQYFLERQEERRGELQLSFELRGRNFNWYSFDFIVEPTVYSPSDAGANITFKSKDGHPIQYKPDSGLVFAEIGDYTLKRIE